MSEFYKAPTLNYKSTTLNGAITDSDTTITVASATNLQASGYIVIDREDGSGTATPSSREVVYYTGISGNDLTGCQRAADNSTARSHNDGALVETMLTVGMWNDLVAIVSTALTSAGVLLPQSTMTIATIRGTNITAGTASITTVKATTVDASTFVGSVGQFYWSRTGALATVLHATATDTHFALQRASKNLSLVTVYAALASAPSLAPLELDISFGSAPTGDFASIFTTRPFIDIGEYTTTSSATPGVLSLTSLASGALLRYEVRKHGEAGELMTQLMAKER
jgi:hypothetical protein